MDKGILYGVGVGPGDPELITLKAVKLIKENQIIAVPGENPSDSAAYKIAAKALPELAEKALIALPMPMQRDREHLDEKHRENAAKIEENLEHGQNVVFLTLGDPDLYSTFSYLRRYVMEAGFEVITVGGVMALSAAAARLNMSIADWDERVRIIPAGHNLPIDSEEGETLVIMKPRGQIAEIKQLLGRSKKDIRAVINCGMDNEVVCNSVEEIPDDAGYFTLMIAK